MQKILTFLLAAGLLASPTLAARNYSAPMQILKGRQKQALKALKLKQKFAKESLKNGQVPEAVRRQLKHQLKREERELRQQQRDERQEMKDRQQVLKLGRR